ncbi:helicase-exonuclease AddAB subunit AddA [uncultured Clostridium sp.]|uniref:helicase-exonuclease AddAB subunit AddA n=1 Tax=uncultured Clostridium sp. TaxID=59620 RepID=UPI0026135501|nr:helicase-exonuclease AddAB subunit AddA [uncultured Clostridium sp.]
MTEIKQKETKWTEEQQLAIKTRKCNLLVAAAAGSGKTAVLVERIIKIVTNEENPIDVDRLLVVTFTKAAAAEMRERIATAITKELEKRPNSKILQKQLTLLSRANITTMHSFCLDVIKNNFHTIDLDPSFRISDETEGLLLKNEIIDDLFEDLYDEGKGEFLDLVEIYSNSKDDESLKEIVKNLYRFVMSGPNPEKWLIEKAEEFKLQDERNNPWIDIISDEVKIETNTFINLYEKALDVIDSDAGLEAYRETFLNELEDIKRLREAVEEDIKEVCNILMDISFGRLKAVKTAEKENKEFATEIRDMWKKKIRKMIENPVFCNIEDAFEKVKLCYPYIKELTNITLEFGKRFSERKKEKNILDFNDLEHLCLKILTDEDGNPSPIALNFREFFDEVLVDEYQDSNNVQEAIINLVSRKNTDNPNVFMVGDVKQSIYRFRQAKPELFLNKYNTYSREEGEKTRVIQLYKNFRSREEVINGVNFTFKKLMSETVGELEYTDEEALNLGASFDEPEEGVEVGGAVEVNIYDKADDGLKIKESDDESEEEEEDIEAINLEARIVCRRIKELMSEDNPFKVEQKTKDKFGKDITIYRKPTFKDIVILLRATKNWSDTFVEELNAEGIPAYADTGSGYFESIEVRTIMSLLKIIDNPMQDVPILSALRSPIFGFSAEDLTDIRMVDKDKYFYENILTLAEREDELSIKCRVFNERLEKWRNRAVYTAIDEFIWYLYMDTAYYGYVGAMPNGKLRQANLKILFQRAKVYEETSFKGLFNFINFINKLRKSSGDMESAKILGENEDVVRIMSIHKSKGLEFPIVFLSGAGKNFNLMDRNKSILFHDELGFGPNYVDLESRLKYPTLPKEAIKKKFTLETLSEEMRILYVAFTRAKEKLIVTGTIKDIEKMSKRWCKAAGIEKDKISEAEVLKGKSYLDWIGMALCQHEDGEILREEGNGDNNMVSGDLSTWKVNLWKKRDLIVEKKSEAVDENEEKKLFINTEEVVVDKEILRRLNFKYPYEELTTLKSNFSVSDLKKANYEEVEAEYEGEALFKEKVIVKPRFLQEKKGLSGAERGTAVHFVMQKIDYDRINSAMDSDKDLIIEIKTQLIEMKENELLTEEEFEVINPWKIKAFFRSNIGKRVMKAYIDGKTVRREFPFFLEVSVDTIKEELQDKNFEETIRIQGIIDLFFEEDGKIILVDYKTDFIKEDAEKEMFDKYAIQMKYYKEALEEITKIPVGNPVLFLFYNEEEIEIKN